jgi:two-component system, response regulator RegA
MGPSVLIVDNDVLLLAACGRALRRVAQLTTATTIQIARQVARTTTLVGVIVDWQLDGENGIDLVRELKEAQPARKVLLWSAYASARVATAAIRAGADDVIEKPVEPRAILRWFETGSWHVDETTPTPTLERMTWQYMRRVYEDCGGNLSEAARQLGVDRATLRVHLQKSAPRR